MNKGERKENQKKDNPGEEHNQGEKQTKISLKGDVTETKGRHDGERPVKTGDPAVIPAFILHEEMEKNTVQADNAKEKNKKF